ncbi:MAG TPA: PAS domain S-box protein [Solirubrobacterales bacterium]|nr:PAS domain S-box protein [Solirubrobacterales bacterium]
MDDPTGSGPTSSTFEQLLEAAPDAMVGVDGQGRIVFVNSQVEAVFGYLRDQLLGEPVEMLVPERFRGAHPERRTGYFAAPRTRPMGADVELYGRRRDGSEFPAEISLSSIETDAGRLATAAIRDVSERRAVERKFEQFLEFAPDGIVGVSPSGEIVLANQQAEALFGYAREEMIGELVEMLVPERFRGAHPGHRDGYFRAPRPRGMGAGVELSAVRKDGTEFPVEISLSSIETEEGVIATAGVRDISDRAESEREKALNEQLAQARRLESVGQLAGGIAHDFNNILGVIMNYAEFVADELEADSQARQDVEEIRRAAERAAALTRQLLIFSRREVVKPELLYLRDVISELENLLRRALGERVELVTRFGEDRCPFEADPGQIEQVLVNLAVNARDAMPDGGRLVIEVDKAELDEEYTYMHPDTEPGTYVRLKVSDTGTGMNPETIQRAFEPFFTTKGKGEGTGLGLATVYGIVTGAGGRIDIYSEIGIGTTVKIHLPASSATPGQVETLDKERPAGNGEVILVVEDEADVRRMAERILTKGGYSVISTGDGTEAIEICGQPDRQIDLLLTDVIMPGLLGTELVERIEVIRPALGVIFMSGYSHEVLAPDTLAEQKHATFIEKPFNAGELLQAVRNLLDAGAGTGVADVS